MAKSLRTVLVLVGIGLLSGCGSGGAPTIATSLDNALAIRAEVEAGGSGEVAAVELPEPTGFASIPRFVPH